MIGVVKVAFSPANWYLIYNMCATAALPMIG